jgi:hypothetical protein
MRVALAGMCLVLLTAGPVVAESVVGSVCIAPLPAKVEEADRSAFAGGPRRHLKYSFTVEIDARPPVPVPKAKPVAVEALELGRPHRVTIRDDGRVIESFRFTFGARGGFPLCLAYAPGYQTWSLERARAQPQCGC